MIKADTLNALAAKIADDSEKHGYRDKQWPAARTMVKAICELAEAVSAFRDVHYAASMQYRSSKTAYIHEHEGYRCSPSYGAQIRSIYEAYAKDTVQDELADAAIYTILAAHNSGLEFDDGGFIYNSSPFSTDDFVTCIGVIMDHMISLRYRKAIEALWWLMKSRYGQDLEFWIREKMEYNHYRPMRHGRLHDPTI